MRTLEHIYLDTDAWTDIGTESNANYSAAQTALENLERTLNSLDDLLSEFGSISRPNQDEHLEKLSRALEAMKHCRQELSGDIEEYIDRPLKRSFNELNDILASIDEREITTPNDLGLDAEKYYFDDLGERHSFRQELKEITMADLMGTHTGPFGTAYDQKIEQFTEVLERDYNYRVLKRNVKTEIDKDVTYTYNDYIREFYTVSETVYVKDMTTAEKMRNAIWRATGAGYIIDGVMGYSLINGDRLTDGERDSRVSEGALTTAFTLLPGAATLGSGEGLAEALLATAKCFEYNALWNAAPDAADEAGIRDLGFVLRLCMAVGAAYEMGKVGYVEGKVAGESSSIKGYSNFADGMSHEDAVKYIANNEAKFYEEFSQRAKTAGLNDIQISEAYSAMKSGDYTKMASYFDTSSPIGGAVFWSGNKEGAAAYANSIGGTIMEQTSGGQVFDNWRGLQGMYPEWNTGTALDQKPIWEAMSTQYAQGATGDVTYAHIIKDGKPYYGVVWKEIEEKILIKNMWNGNISNIMEVIIDGK